MYVPSQQLRADLSRWEGESLTVYPDSRGLATQGIGRHHGVSFGDPPITPEIEAQWLTEDIQGGYQAALALIPGLDALDVVRKEALIALAFNLGQETLSEFGPFLGHVNASRWSEAAFHLLTNTRGRLTPYLLQTGARAVETALRIATGEVLKEFRCN